MIAGLTLGVAFGLNFILNSAGTIITTLLSYLLILLILYMTYAYTCHYRDNAREGQISYLQSLAYIITLYFYASIISAFIKVIYLQWINTDLIGNILNESVTLLEQFEFSDIDQYKQQMTQMLTPINFSIHFIWFDTFIGLIVGLIMSAFTSKNKRRDNTI